MNGRERSDTGILLAGGQSSRMGQPKMAMRIRGESLLAHTARALLACCQEVLIIGAPQGCADGVNEALEDLGSTPELRILRDQHAYQGPLPAILRGLREARHELCFVAAGDSPFLSPDLVGGMLDTLRSDPASQALVPRVDGFRQPLTAAYRCQPMASHFGKALARGENSPTASLEGALVREVPEDDLRAWDPRKRSFLNINSAEDLAAARALPIQATANSSED